MKFRECVRNLGDSLRVIGQDFIKGHRFWLPVVLAIVPSVLLAKPLDKQPRHLTPRQVAAILSRAASA